MSLFLLWIVQITRVVGREHCLGTGIAKETIPSGFPVFQVVVPGCSGNSYGTSPNLWVQKKLVKLEQSTQNTCLRPTEFFESFLVTLPSISSEISEMYSWVVSGSSEFRDWVSLVFSGVSLETAASFLLFFNVAINLREKISQLWKLIWVFNFITQAKISSYYEVKVSTKTNS